LINITKRILSLLTIFPQKELSIKLGVNRSQLQRWVNNKTTPKKHNRQKINRFYNYYKKRIEPKKVETRQREFVKKRTRQVFKRIPMSEYLNYLLQTMDQSTLNLELFIFNDIYDNKIWAYNRKEGLGSKGFILEKYQKPSKPTELVKLHGLIFKGYDNSYTSNEYKSFTLPLSFLKNQLDLKSVPTGYELLERSEELWIKLGEILKLGVNYDTETYIGIEFIESS